MAETWTTRSLMALTRQELLDLAKGFMVESRSTMNKTALTAELLTYINNYPFLPGMDVLAYYSGEQMPGKVIHVDRNDSHQTYQVDFDLGERRGHDQRWCNVQQMEQVFVPVAQDDVDGAIASIMESFK